MTRNANRGAITRVLHWAVGPCLILIGLAIIAGGFDIKGFAQGNAQGDFEDVTCVEFWTWPEPPDGDSDLGEYLGKDVASATAAVVGDPDFGESVRISLSGAYPSYGVQCDVDFTIGVAGGEDVELGQPTIEPLTGLSGANCQQTADDTLSCAEITAIFEAPSQGICLPAGTELTTRLTFHIEQAAQENAEMSFEALFPADNCNAGDPDPEDPGAPNDPENEANPLITEDGTAVEPLTTEVAGATDSATSASQADEGDSEDRLIDEVLGVRQLPETGNGGLLALERNLKTASGASLVAAGVLLILLRPLSRRKQPR